MSCHVSWPLKALRALCRCASRKRSQQCCNNKVCCVGGRLGCWAPASVCVRCTCMHMCVPSCFLSNAFVCDHKIYTHVEVSSCECAFWMCWAMSVLYVHLRPCSCFDFRLKTFVFISIFLSENVFPGLKCQLSAVNLCSFCLFCLVGGGSRQC